MRMQGALVCPTTRCRAATLMGRFMIIAALVTAAAARALARNDIQQRLLVDIVPAGDNSAGNPFCRNRFNASAAHRMIAHAEGCRQPLRPEPTNG